MKLNRALFGPAESHDSDYTSSNSVPVPDMEMEGE